VQSALLEVMQERQVTIAHTSYPVPSPFLVMATQNPIESEGTYPLPEAQLDRFMLKILIDYPEHDEELTIVQRQLVPHPELREALSLEDLKLAVTSQSKQILGLRRETASLRKALEDTSLTAQARAQLQAKLDRAKAQLGALRVAHQQTIRRGRLATITVNFTTGDLPELPAKPSRIHKAIDRAWNGLSSEISWATMAIIVASPFLLLAALLAVLVRFRKRREERRLLEK